MINFLQNHNQDNNKGKFSLPFFICLILVFLFWGLVNYSYSLTNKDFIIYQNESLEEIADRLEEEKIINFKPVFILTLRILGQDKNIYPGYYSFPDKISLSEIINTITTPSNQRNILLVIKEGETLKEVEENLKNAGFIINRNFLDYQIKDFLEIDCLNNLTDNNNLSLEGFIFPDSYYLSLGAEEEELLKIFLKNFCQKTKQNEELMKQINDFQKNFSDLYPQEIRKEEKKDYSPSFYDILKMASILEKEVKDNQEKRMVADLLWRRLLSEMPLQVDCTICYGLFFNFKDCDLNPEDFLIPSPYNTYLLKGLPSTPVSNPGLHSIEAAISPIRNDYWFYLTDRESGKTIFSVDYDNHLEARDKYIK